MAPMPGLTDAVQLQEVARRRAAHPMQPPDRTECRYRRLAAELQRRLGQASRGRPWREDLRVRLAGNGDRAGLTAWVVAGNVLHAVWAASVHRGFPCEAGVICPELRRVVITAPRHARTGYAPGIVWEAGRRKRAGARSWDAISHPYQEFGRLEKLLACSAFTDPRPQNGPFSKAELLWQAGRNRQAQRAAIRELIEWNRNLGNLACSADEALGTIDGGRAHIRWQAIALLARHGMLRPGAAGGRALRLAGTAATPSEILELVSRAFGRSQDILTGPDRSYRAMHPRYFAAAAIRQATSRTLSEIGTVLGGRDPTPFHHPERAEADRPLDQARSHSREAARPGRPGQRQSRPAQAEEIPENGNLRDQGGWRGTVNRIKVRPAMPAAWSGRRDAEAREKSHRIDRHAVETIQRRCDRQNRLA